VDTDAIPSAQQPALPAPGRGKGKRRQSTSRRPRTAMIDVSPFQPSYPNTLPGGPPALT
jgi:hypothetical protein